MLFIVFKLFLIIVALVIAFLFFSKIIPLILSYFEKLKRQASGSKTQVSQWKESLDISGLFEAYSEPEYTKKIKILAAIAGFLFGLVVTLDIIFAMIFSIITTMIVISMIKKIISNNKMKFEEQFLEALNIISSSVRTGSSLMQALEDAAKQTKKPVSAEFEEILRQVNLGEPVDKALKGLESKINSYDLHLAVLSINITREFGGNLSSNLDLIAETIMNRKKIRNKVNAITSQGKLSAWIITVMPFLLLAVLNFMEPAMFGLMFTTLLGKIMLCASILMAAVGNYIIMKIVTVEV